MKKLFQEFKNFAIKGNMIEIAIGVIIGAAFNKVVDVIVKQILMPPLSLLTGGLNFENKKLILKEAVAASAENGNVAIEEVAIGYGKLIETSIDFFVVAFTIFLVVKVINQYKDKAQDPKDKTVKTPKDLELLDRIGDLLEKQNEMLAKK